MSSRAAFISRRLLVTALLLAATPAAAQRLYMAGHEQSHWESRAEAGACHLSHSVPLFGTAVFSEDRQGQLGMSVYPYDPQPAQGLATVLLRGAPWKPAPERELEQARLHAPGPLLRLSAHASRQLLIGLETGQMPVLRLERDLGEDRAEVALSPVGFRAGLRDHLRCLAGLPQTPSPAAAAALDPLVRLGYAQAPVQPALALALEGGAPVREATAPPTVAAAANGEAPLTVYFATDNAGLDHPAMATLDRFARRLQANPGWRAVIFSGHADIRGAAAYNLSLGRRRAEAVKAYLEARGVGPERVRLESRGAQFASAAQNDTQGMALDRRVAIEVIR